MVVFIGASQGIRLARYLAETPPSLLLVSKSLLFYFLFLFIFVFIFSSLYFSLSSIIIIVVRYIFPFIYFYNLFIPFFSSWHLDSNVHKQILYFIFPNIYGTNITSICNFTEERKEDNSILKRELNCGANFPFQEKREFLLETLQ